ncbi:MAG TPA: hypothetical protein VHL34_22100 [Rhizomicrobium sp.]|nr:hypothetical protein [Rhizomicrobium sp.]
MSGAYEFRTNDRKNGVPVCTERWSFGADGVMTIESGQEVVRETYTLTHDDVGDWIIANVIDTNGKPDCMGNARTEVPKGTDRIYWFAMNDGTINVCPPPALNPVFVSGCYATLQSVKP